MNFQEGPQPPPADDHLHRQRPQPQQHHHQLYDMDAQQQQEQPQQQQQNMGVPFGPDDGKEHHTLMWQQGHYMGEGGGDPSGSSLTGSALMVAAGHHRGGGESGFVSGGASTTQASSQTGHEDLDESCFTGPGSIAAGSSLYDLDSAQPSEVSSVHSSQAAFGGLSDPEEFIPRLVTALCDDDPVVVHESLILVERCVKKENFFTTMVRAVDLVRAIVQALVVASSNMASAANALAVLAASGGDGPGGGPGGGPRQKSRALLDQQQAGADEEQQQRLQEQLELAEKRTKSASNILRAMTNHRDPREGQRESEDNQWVACQNILMSRGMQPLTALLACPIDRIKFNAIATIHSLLLCLDQDERAREAAKSAVREADGVQMMVALLKRDNVKLLTILTDCLRILAMKHQPTKMIILQGGGPQLLINIMKNQAYRNLVLMTARLLKVLSVCQHNKQAIIQAGGMEALARHLRSDQSKITYNCSWTMRNLSDVATNIGDPSSLAAELVNLLRHPEEPVIICAAGIISNLTVNNERIKLAICEARGIDELVRVVDMFGRNQELLEPAVCGIRHLTNNHKAADAAQRLFLYDLAGLQKIGRWLHPAAHRPSVKAVLGVVRNLAQRPANHQILRATRTADHVFMMVSCALDALASPNGCQPVEGVRLEEIVEAGLSCIFHLAKEPSNRPMILDINSVQLFRRVLGFVLSRLGQGGPPMSAAVVNSVESSARLAVGVCNEIASAGPDGAFVIHKEGLADPIKILLGYKNEKIASYCSSIIFHINNLMRDMDKGKYQPPQSHHFFYNQSESDKVMNQGPQMQGFGVVDPGFFGQHFHGGPHQQQQQQQLPQHHQQQPPPPPSFQGGNPFPTHQSIGNSNGFRLGNGGDPFAPQGISHNQAFDEMMAEPPLSSQEQVHGGQLVQQGPSQMGYPPHHQHHQHQHPEPLMPPLTGGGDGPVGFMEDMSMDLCGGGQMMSPSYSSSSSNNNLPPNDNSQNQQHLQGFFDGGM